MAVNTRAGYSLLQRSLPVFLALVSTDSSLWTERQGLLLISVARALDSPRYEIRRFVFYDIMIAFALGTPPLIQYDTSDFPVIPAVVGPLEWVHGIPIELTVNVVQVNAWRASNPGIPNVNDWTDLELRALAWIPRAMELAGDDSYEVVTRLSVQETWRQAILIYVYMVSLSTLQPYVLELKFVVWFLGHVLCRFAQSSSSIFCTTDTPATRRCFRIPARCPFVPPVSHCKHISSFLFSPTLKFTL